MNFNELLNLISSDNARNICVDSRTVADGDIFVAVKGTACDGHDFIDQALDNGAEYIVCQSASDRCTQNDADVVVVDDSIEAAALLAQTIRGNPACRLTGATMTAVFCTNGD